MRFVCDSCRAQYMISDEKVGSNGVKVRCKKCGYVILVRKAEAPAAASMPLPPVMDDDEGEGKTQIMQNPMISPDDGKLGGGRSSSTAVLKGIQDDEISGVFDQVLTGKPRAAAAAPPEDDSSASLGGEADDRLQTRVLDAEMMQKLASESNGDSGDNAAPRKSNGNGASHDWFVAIDEKQSGPLSIDKLKDLWARGEIGPDSLCWRAGFSDWIPLSEAEELSSVLAPKPARPVIVAPGVAAPVVTVPVESAFSAGGVTKTVRSEVPVSFAAPSVEDTGSWKPSAASALASLVQEEISVLSKPKPSASQDTAMPGMGMLDLPSPEARPVNGNHAAVVAAPSMSADMMHQPYAATSRPPPNTTGGSRKGVMIALIAGGVVVIGLLVTIVALLMKDPSSPAADNPPVAAAPQPAKTEALPMPPPPPGTVQKPVVAAPVVTQKDPEPPKIAAPTAPSAPTSPDERPAAKVRKPTVVEDDDEVGSFTAGKKPSKPIAEATGTDDEFDAVFGSPSASSKPKTAAPAAKKAVTTYIPPPPGSADIPERLGTSDVMQVVLANKPAIAKCVAEQKKKDPDVSGKLVMKWTILTSGRTSNVAAVSDEFRSAYVASCIGGLIKSWQFPKHKVQGDPINFPFTF